MTTGVIYSTNLTAGVDYNFIGGTGIDKGIELLVAGIYEFTYYN